MGAQMNIHHFEWAELAEATPITLPRPSSGNFFWVEGGGAVISAIADRGTSTADGGRMRHPAAGRRDK